MTDTDSVKTTLKSFLWILPFIFFLTACKSTATPPPTPEPMQMTFMAGYKPQANLPFVGVYLAQENGYFQEEGLEVKIEHTGGSGQHLQLLAAGEVQVTTQDAGVLLQRRADPGLPLVSIALIGQRGQQAYAALANSGMNTPQDWSGHIVGYKGTPPPDLYAILRANNLIAEDIELVNVGFDPRLLTEGKVDVYPVYKSNEPFLIQSWGYELVLWEAADFGVPNLGLAYVTSEEILASNPELLEGFLRAALRGIDYAIAHPEEAVEAVMKYTGPETDPDHMRFMEITDAISPLTDTHGIGWQTLEQWQALADMLAEYEITPQIDASKAFTNTILESIQIP
jgi:ABC-type nitrate/sulfonate/bicarbonate transport system substrate-binding protein